MQYRMIDVFLDRQTNLLIIKLGMCRRWIIDERGRLCAVVEYTGKKFDFDLDIELVMHQWTPQCYRYEAHSLH